MRSIIDTNATGLRVTLSLISPIVEVDKAPIMLDGLLSWARALDGDLQPLLPDVEPIVPLPFARWQDGDMWGWCASQATYEVAGFATSPIPPTPDTMAMAQYGADKKHHLALGPHKARDSMAEAAWVHTMTFDALVVDVTEFQRLLERVTHVGRFANVGYGEVATRGIEAVENPAWENRHFGVFRGKPQRTRPPYWHPVGRDHART